jgi:hypothetical protein
MIAVLLSAVSLLGPVSAGFASVPDQAVVKAAPVRYVGRTAEGRSMTMTVTGTQITHFTVTVADYACHPTGAAGPIHVRVRPQDARIDGRRRYAFHIARGSEQVYVIGILRHGNRTMGRVRVTGTRPAGERCGSPAHRFDAAIR